MAGYYNNNKRNNPKNTMPPKKKYVSDEAHAFINPYNFVRLNSFQRGDVLNPETENEKLVSGKIECRLIPTTPLIIPDSESVTEKDDHKTYTFFHLTRNNEPEYCIPGSTIRGVVRSMYETVTDSCMTGARSSEPFSMRRQDKPFTPGLLTRENGELKLYEAKKYGVSVFSAGTLPSGKSSYPVDYSTGEILIQKNRMKTGSTVTFDPVPKIATTGLDYAMHLGDGQTTGYICVGESFPQKKHESIFVKKAQVMVDPKIVEEAYQNFKTNLKIYRDDKINLNLGSKSRGRATHYGYPGYRNTDQFLEKEGACLPVWYDYNREIRVIYMSPAQMGRTVFHSSLATLVQGKAPCTDRKSLCKACSVFGMIAGSNVEAGMGSRIRFSDGVYDEKGKLLKEITLDPLNNPKPSFMRFYTIGQMDQESYDGNVEINGRKFYWHSVPRDIYYPGNGTDSNKFNKIPKTKMNGTYDAIKGGSFEFTVYYDNIPEARLRELLWVLTIGDNRKESPYQYKIGHAKPLGFGSSKITIESVTMRDFSMDEGWHVTDVVGEKQVSALYSQAQEAFVPSVLSQILKISDTRSTEGQSVRYPYIVNSEKHPTDNKYASHQWFRQFKVDHKKDSDRLPAILADNLTLNAYRNSEETEASAHTERMSQRPVSQAVSGKYQEGKEYEVIVTQISEDYRDSNRYYIKGKVTVNQSSARIVAKKEEAGDITVNSKIRVIFLGINKETGFPRWKFKTR